MKAILPGRPQAKLQALCTAYWDGLRIVAYISGNAVVILKGPREILQTIYVDDVDELQAVTIEDTSGRLSICSEEHVYIYGAIGRDEGVLKWSRIQDLDTKGIQPVSTISWGSDEELLIGGQQLTLWNIPHSEPPTRMWTTKLANPAKFAQFSHDAGLIASCGNYDRLVKIWRRLSYELDGTRFDVSYLSHPTAVTNLHWRKPWHAEQSLDNLLYTFCADNQIRVWSHSDHHAKSVMQFLAQIDMNASIQPRRLSIGSTSKKRYGFILDSRDFLQTTEKAVQNGPVSGTDHALEHLIEVANRSPEVCVVLDGLGHMSAWGLENAGCKNKEPTSVFNIAHVEGLNVSFGKTQDPEEDYAQMCIFAGVLADSTLTILVQTYDGKIDWYDSKITEMFDLASRKDRVQLISSWTGHHESVEHIDTNFDGNILLSVDDDGGGILWKYDRGRLLGASRFDNVETDDEILQSIVAADGKHIALLHAEDVTIWSTRTEMATMIARAQHSSRNQKMCLVKIGSVPDIHMSLINAAGKVETWKLNLPTQQRHTPDGVNGHHSLLSKGDVSHVDFLLDTSHLSAIQGQPNAQEVVVAASRTGIVQVLRCELSLDRRKLLWASSQKLNTNVEKPKIIRAISNGQIAIVDEGGTTLSIWDLRHGWLEYEHTFSGNDTIEQVSWMTTPSGQSLLAIGLQFRIVILSQVRFDAHGEHLSWMQAKELRLRDFATHALGDLCWLQGADLLIGAGNQLFVKDIRIDVDGMFEKHLEDITMKNIDISKAVSQANTSLALFHPTCIHFLISMGRMGSSHDLLNILHKKLRYWSEGDDLSDYLGLDPAEFIVQNEREFYDLRDNTIMDEEKAAALSSYLEDSELHQISSSNRIRLSRMAKHLAMLHLHQCSVDENALRYMYLSEILTGFESDPSPATFREIIFASRSASQDILVDQVVRSANGKLTWSHARTSGLFMWLEDAEAVGKQLEVIARNEYTNTDDRSPVECSLYYFALRKKNVLQGLWRMAPGLREQKNTLKLLANNFEDPKWKTTALKNAYVLLSKRRFMYAAAFFLLGGSLKDAVNVCVHQLEDIQLAVAIARVYEGNKSSVLKNLITSQILPDAIERGDRWCASWAFGMLGMRDRALQSLVKPLHTLLDGISKTEEIKESTSAKHWRNFDPTLAILYCQLRDELAKDPKASYMGGVTEKEEWDFVLRCAAQYTRMGCDWLALDMVKNWKFLPRQHRADVIREAGDPSAEGFETESDTIRSEKKKPLPTQFQEPSASSLLDSFGF